MHKIFRYLSLKQRLLLIILVTSTVSVMLISLALNYVHYNSVKKQLVNELEIASALIINNISAALAFDDKQRIEDVLGSVKDNENVIYACVYDARGNIAGQFTNTDANRQCLAVASRTEDISEIQSKNLII